MDDVSPGFHPIVRSYLRYHDWQEHAEMLEVLRYDVDHVGEFLDGVRNIGMSTSQALFLWELSNLQIVG